MTHFARPITAFLFILLLASPALADQKTGFYVSLSPAITSPAAEPTTLDEVEIDSTNILDPIIMGQDAKFKMKFGLGINGEVGYKWLTNIRTGLEVGYRASDIDQVKSTAGSGLVDGQLETSTVFLNIAYDFDNEEGPAPYIFGGMGAAYNELDLRSVNSRSVRQVADDLTFAFQVGAGFYKPLNEFIDAGLGYRFVFVNDTNFGNISTEFGVHHIELTFRLF